MLTKTQLWRRAGKRPRRQRTLAIKEESPPAIKIELNTCPSPEPIKLKSALSSGNLSDMERKQRNRRVVRFSTTVHVLLIPSRFDLLAYFLNIYFTSEDYQRFKRDAVTEIRDMASRHSISVKQALNILYQPSPRSPLASSPDFADGDVTDESHSQEEEWSSVESGGGGWGGSAFSSDMSRTCADKDLHFIIRAKTDLELNAEWGRGGGRGGDRQVCRVSTHSTPSLSRPQHLWSVQWRKGGPVTGRGVV